jgi:hypothetical protein
MKEKVFDVNSLRVASPCSVGWENMTGDEQVRKCDTCELNIYNTASMTQKEVEHLILNREGRLCIRLHRRADGTVITKDCPVGLRAYRKRIACSVTATLSLILGLFTASFSQQKASAHPKSKNNIIIPNKRDAKAKLIGRIVGSNGAVVLGAEIRLFKGHDKKALKATSDDAGNYVFSGIGSGTYRLEVKAKGSNRSIVENISVKEGYISTANVELHVAGSNVTVGIYTEEPMIDMTSTSVTTVISSDGRIWTR